MNRPCVIVDDEKLAREKIELFLSYTDGVELKGSFASASTFLDTWKDGQNLLVFLDINLPDLNGLELAPMINKRNQIIFSTAYAEHALDGFDLDAVDYLLKPFNYHRFMRAVNKAQQLYSLPDFVMIKEGKKTHRLNYTEIDYIEGLKEYVVWHSGRGRIVELNSLKHLEQKLKSLGFLQVHKSFIVNFAKVEFFEANALRIKDKTIPIGRTFKSAVAQFVQ